MRPGRLNLVVAIGSTWSHTLTWYVDEEQSAPQDLTGWSARAQARRRHGDDDTLFSLTSDPAAGITLGDALGTIVLELTAAQTEAIPPLNAAVWDLELVDTDEKVYRLVEGTVQFTPEVTR